MYKKNCYTPSIWSKTFSGLGSKKCQLFECNINLRRPGRHMCGKLVALAGESRTCPVTQQQQQRKPGGGHRAQQSSNRATLVKKARVSVLDIPSASGDQLLIVLVTI